MHSNTILLLHGFNSAPGKKAEEIQGFLQEKNLANSYKLIAPQLENSPKDAIQQIHEILTQQANTKRTVIGTSLGGFYANYIRAYYNKGSALSVHAINPSWRPSTTLQRYSGEELQNLKTQDTWVFTAEYLNEINILESYIATHLKAYSCQEDKFTLHLAYEDELLHFDGMLDYLTRYQTPHRVFYYDTDHRFGEIRKVMEQVVNNQF